jgi:hypothetical protein
MAIGKIDCTVEKEVCKEYGVRAYPTLKFSLDGAVFDYPGGRDADSIMAFAEKMNAPAVTLLKSYEEAMEFTASQSEEQVAFVGYDKSALGETVEEMLQSSSLGKVYSQVARKQKAFASFGWLAPNAEGLGHFRGVLTFVNRLETGVSPRLYETHDYTVDGLNEFVKKENFPTIATFAAHNFQKLGNKGRPLVIGVVDATKDDQVDAVRNHMKEFITNEDHADMVEKYYFGIMDGIKFGKFLEQFRVYPDEIPQVFMLDLPKKIFWQNTTYPDVYTFMKGVEKGDISADVPESKKGLKGALGKVEDFFVRYFPWSLVAILAFIFGCVFLMVPAGEDFYQPPYDREQNLPPEEYEPDSAKDQGAKDDKEGKKDK